jgi:hypothetical protein
MEWTLRFKFPTRFLYAFIVFYACYVPRPPDYPWFNHTEIFRVAYNSYKPSLCSLLQPPVTSSLLDPNILLSTLFSDTLSLCEMDLAGQEPVIGDGAPSSSINRDLVTSKYLLINWLKIMLFIVKCHYYQKAIFNSFITFWHHLRGSFGKFVDWRQCTTVMQRETVTVTP